ncbi:MAG: hypothetical protein EOO52_01260 [Gammaproteobacteria bacterium]|nr:MAG: hypothetical protein EOO52_01260 [Gammaproteobacteria bacterium]
MSEFEADIEKWILEKYKNPQRAKLLLEPLLRLDTAVSKSRIVRCVLVLAESDYDSLDVYVSKAMVDFRDIIWMSEYDNRNVRRYDFDVSLYEQESYKYEE